MNAARETAIDSFGEAARAGNVEPLLAHARSDVVADWSNSIGPLRGRYEGGEELRAVYASFAESFVEIAWEPSDLAWLSDDLVVFSTRLEARGRDSGVPTTSHGGQAWAFDGDRVRMLKVFQTREEALAWGRREALDGAGLYLVTDACGGPESARVLIDAALAGGVDVLQLRDRSLGADALAAAGTAFREAASNGCALFFANDDPALARGLGADGVHVGQNDAGVAQARAQAGAGALVGLSTHSPEQLDAACSATGDARPDYISVGPVWATPTKPGRPAAGLDYVSHAAANATLPWFAIGGIDAANVSEVVDAGATRIVVVRAIRDAADPAAAARALREAVVKSS